MSADSPSVPTLIPSCYIWYAADDINNNITDQPTDNSALSSLKAKAGFPKNQDQPTGANQPTFSFTSFNGKPGITFVAANQNYLSNTSAGINGPNLTIFVVANQVSDPAGVSTLSLSGTASAYDYNDVQSLVPFQSGSGGAFIQGFRDGGALSTATNPGNDVPYISTTLFDGTNNTLYLNGVAQTPVASTGDFASDRFLIGPRWVGGSIDLPFCFDGVIAEIIIYLRDLSVSERENVERYLANKWGISI